MSKPEGTAIVSGSPSSPTEGGRTSSLFEPLHIRGVTLRNRIGVSPMCQYSCGSPAGPAGAAGRDDALAGMATDWHLVHLGSRAVGGAALVCVEATAVEARGRISPGDMGLWSDAHAAPLARIAAFVKSQGAVAAIQLAHAGRKASVTAPWQGDRPLADAEGGWEPVASSPIPFADGWRMPHALSVSEIKEIIGRFRDAAVRACDAGFEWLELHAAHGYLLHQFLSPLSNRRDDDWGGSFDDRCRLVIEVVRAVRRVWPQRLPLAIRLSCTDWMPNGWTLEDSLALATRLGREEVDLVDCSSGGVVPGVQIPVGAGYQVRFAEAIRKCGVATAAVGLITEASHADEIIRNGRADLVLLARELLRDPYWPLHAAATLHHPDRVPVPPQYQRAYAGPLAGAHPAQPGGASAAKMRTRT